MVTDDEFALASERLAAAHKAHPGFILPHFEQDQAHEAWTSEWAGDAVSRLVFRYPVVLTPSS
jgi:hypothetical protein